MLLTSTSKYAQCFKWPQFTSNTTFPTAKQQVHTHANPCLLAQNGKTTLMSGARFWRHLHAVDCWKFHEYLANAERQYSLFYSKWKVGFFFWFFMHLLCNSVFLSTETAKKNGCRFFHQDGHLAKVVLLWTCLLNSVQYERNLLNSVQYENLIFFINANWTWKLLGYIIIPYIKSLFKLL